MKTVDLWWKSWYGNEKTQISLPESWDTKTFTLNSPPPITDQQIKEQILNPCGCPPLSQLAKSKKTVCIAVDDLTKPTEAFRIAPLLIEELVRGGIDKENIYFVISLGSHRALTLADFRKKLGQEIASNFRIYNHSPYQNNQYIGKTSFGTELYIDKLYLEADLKIAIGMVMPHNLAGFSGGGKIVLPGLASIDTVEANHRSTLRGLQGKVGSLTGNKVRADIDEAARMAGLDFICNSIHGTDGKTVKIFCGDMSQAFKQAVKEAVEVYSCYPRYNEDVGIFNAFPRDNWFLLSLSSLDIWATRDKDKAIVKKGGTIVIINQCSEGAGEHGLHTRGMRHYVFRDEHGTFKEILEDRELIFFSPNLNYGIIKDYYRKKASLCKSWEEVLKLLQEKHRDDASASIYPCGTLQMDRSVIDKESC